VVDKRNIRCCLAAVLAGGTEATAIHVEEEAREGERDDVEVEV